MGRLAWHYFVTDLWDFTILKILWICNIPQICQLQNNLKSREDGPINKLYLTCPYRFVVEAFIKTVISNAWVWVHWMQSSVFISVGHRQTATSDKKPVVQTCNNTALLVKLIPEFQEKPRRCLDKGIWSPVLSSSAKHHVLCSNGVRTETIF